MRWPKLALFALPGALALAGGGYFAGTIAVKAPTVTPLDEQAPGDQAPVPRSLFDTQIYLLSGKADQCNSEISATKKAGRFCDDFSDYSDSVFKGSAQSFIEYHMGNGDINKGNADVVVATLKKASLTNNRIIGRDPAE